VPVMIHRRTNVSLLFFIIDLVDASAEPSAKTRDLARRLELRLL